LKVSKLIAGFFYLSHICRPSSKHNSTTMIKSTVKHLSNKYCFFNPQILTTQDFFLARMVSDLLIMAILYVYCQTFDITRVDDNLI